MDTGDRMGAGIYAERKALWRESDTVPEAGEVNKNDTKISLLQLNGKYD